MLKRVDNAVYDAFKSGDALEAGFNVMDLSNGGVGYAVDENNANLITAEMAAALEEAQAKIVAGEISVHNYNSDESCPALDF
jgi:basic membrane protein A